MVKYSGLFMVLAKKGMKKTDLLEVISSPTLAKLSKGEIVKTDIIDKLCIFLGCQPSDIMHVEVEEVVTDTNTHEKLLHTYMPIFDFNTGRTDIDTVDVAPIQKESGTTQA